MLHTRVLQEKPLFEERNNITQGFIRLRTEAILNYGLQMVYLPRAEGIMGPKRHEMAGEWRKLHNEELRDLYSSPSLIGITKSRRLKLTGHVERMGKTGKRIGYWWESQRERDD
jgi:hypothetical protein